MRNKNLQFCFVFEHFDLVSKNRSYVLKIATTLTCSSPCDQDSRVFLPSLPWEMKVDGSKGMLQNVFTIDLLLFAHIDDRIKEVAPGSFFCVWRLSLLWHLFFVLIIRFLCPYMSQLKVVFNYFNYSTIQVYTEDESPMRVRVKVSLWIVEWLNSWIQLSSFNFDTTVYVIVFAIVVYMITPWFDVIFCFATSLTTDTSFVRVQSQNIFQHFDHLFVRSMFSRLTGVWKGNTHIFAWK